MEGSRFEYLSYPTQLSEENPRNCLIMRLWKIIYLTLLVALACKKTSSGSFNNIRGVFAAGQGCQGWLIKQDDNVTRQPLNLDSFNIVPKSGDTIVFSYYIADMLNVCMDGKTIELTSIRKW
jgi:hypothetical protein